MVVLITGANGFVGRQVVSAALAAGHQVKAATRLGQASAEHPCLRSVVVGDIHRSTDWRSAVAGVHAVIHLAGRAHIMKDRASDPLAAFRAVNTEGARRLAEAAAEAGVRRFVYVSSIKVSGERTAPGRPFREVDPPSPNDPYGISKWEGEQAIAEVARRTGMETVVVRPPLVYGPGVKANFLGLLRWVDRGLPLPFRDIDNRRSLVSTSNLADLLLTCVQHPAAAGETFFASDAEALSTGALVRALAKALGRPARVWPFPPRGLEALGTALGRRAQVRRLCDWLEVDRSKARQRLGWLPPRDMERELSETARWYRREELR